MQNITTDDGYVVTPEGVMQAISLAKEVRASYQGMANSARTQVASAEQWVAKLDAVVGFAEIAASELPKLQARLEELKALLEAESAQSDQLAAEIEEKNARIAQLEAQLAQYQQPTDPQPVQEPTKT